MNTLATVPRTVRIPADFLAALHRALSQDQSPVAAATLLRHVGYEAGGGVFDSFEDWLAGRELPETVRSLPIERFWSAFSDFFEELGWGTVRHTQLHPGVAALDCEDWLEADSQTGVACPGCHLSTGLFADVLRRLAGEDLAVIEVECRSRGDAQCRFLVGSPATLETVYAVLVEGASYRDALERLA
jgi:predicted hydrocarbon binding protein